MTAALESSTREYTWRITQGARERLVIPVFRDGSPEDVSAWTVDARIRTQPGGELLYTWPAELISVLGPEVTLTVPAPVSSSWAWERGWYRVVLTAPAGTAEDPESWRVLQGELVVDPE